VNFQEAKAKFAKCRDYYKGYRLRGRQGSTRLVKIDDSTYGIRLHATIVVKIHSDGTYTLNSGGWHTKVTKERIEEYAPVNISSFKWVLPQGSYYWHDNKTRAAHFVDGMRVNSKGALVKGFGNGSVTLAQARDIDRAARNARARARRLAAKEAFARRNPDKVCSVGRAIYGAVGA
jgi:hypothetical protein